MTYDERIRMAHLVEVMELAIHNTDEVPKLSDLTLREIANELSGLAHPITKAA